MKLYWNMIGRVDKILNLAQESNVRVMIDAEWIDIQPAIDHIVHRMQVKYNMGAQPIVFNTYQTYLKGMEDRVKLDLERSVKEGWRFGAKVVRGAYMVSEREKAKSRDVDSPIARRIFMHLLMRFLRITLELPPRMLISKCQERMLRPRFWSRHTTVAQ